MKTICSDLLCKTASIAPIFDLFLILLNENLLIICRRPVSAKNIKNRYVLHFLANLSSFLYLTIYPSFIYH
jgi:hypothetical protein